MQKKILVAPLDWGLGHATRCIPVINALLERGAEVLIAADGRPFALLQNEFPDLKIIRFSGKSILYPENGKLIRSMIVQLPSFWDSIKEEHRDLAQIVEEHEINIVVSDNRYGVWHTRTKNVFITHQLFIDLPWHWKWASPILNMLVARLIAKFDQCWIPDVEAEPNLSGRLSHGSANSKRIKFIGPLSRYEARSIKESYELVIVLSGPEPQRTLLEKKILSQLPALKMKSMLVRGVTESNEVRRLDDFIIISDHMTASALNTLMCSADLIIARPGYSTLMDLAAIGGRACFIPTPGQTEQEYLADKLQEEQLATYQTQDGLDLKELVAEAKHYKGFDGLVFQNKLNEVVDNILL